MSINNSKMDSGFFNEVNLALGALNGLLPADYEKISFVATNDNHRET